GVYHHRRAAVPGRRTRVFRGAVTGAFGAAAERCRERNEKGAGATRAHTYVSRAARARGFLHPLGALRAHCASAPRATTSRRTCSQLAGCPSSESVPPRGTIANFTFRGLEAAVVAVGAPTVPGIGRAAATCLADALAVAETTEDETGSGVGSSLDAAAVATLVF